MNAIKDSIKSGRTVVGTAGAPNVDVSMLADAGFDFLLFDTQHSPWEIKQLQPSIVRGAKLLARRRRIVRTPTIKLVPGARIFAQPPVRRGGVSP